MALGIGLEPITLWLTARCSTIELPKNKCNHLMCGWFEQPSSHCVSYSTVELTHDYCVVYTVRHPWSVEPFTAVYKYRMEDGTGFEPVVVLMNDISLAKRLNKPLWQPSMWVCVKTGYLRSHSNGDTLTPTTMVATHSGFTLWRMLGSNQRLLFSRLWTVKFLESNQYVQPYSALPLS